MSIQNGRPGSPIGSTAPIVGYGGASMPQHPLASPQTQHINAPSIAPAAPGSHTLVSGFQQPQPTTNFGASPKFVSGRYGA